MLKLSTSETICEYADLVYSKFLEKVYGINSCLNTEMLDNEEDYKLRIEFSKSGLLSAEQASRNNVDIGLLGNVSGIGNFYNIINNTFITNNYTVLEATGYVHIQASAQTTWTITNPLPFCPNVTIVDANGQRISGQINYDSTCTIITITFNAPFSGKAYLS